MQPRLLQRILRHLALRELLLCCAVSHAWCLPPLPRLPNAHTHGATLLASAPSCPRCAALRVVRLLRASTGS
jgi:hypothetical protein